MRNWENLKERWRPPYFLFSFFIMEILKHIQNFPEYCNIPPMCSSPTLKSHPPKAVSFHLYCLDATTISYNQFSSVTQSCPTLCDPVNDSTPGLPVHHQLPEFTQTHVHRVRDATQPSHPLSSPSPPAPNPSQHQSLFQ